MIRWLILVAICLLSGCASTSKNSISNNQQTASTAVNHSMGNDELLFYLLQKEFSYWQATPYRLGGNSKKGIDCSASVQNIYHDAFNISLPRTTERQVQQGYFIYKDQLQVGDLVFFKTGWNIRHVGIYIGDHKFIHASTNKGVTSSVLNNVYWKGKYWQARRILESSKLIMKEY